MYDQGNQYQSPVVKLRARWAMKAAVEARAVDIIQPDVCGVGGFSEFKRVVDHAQMNGVRVVPHVWGTVSKLLQAYKIAAIRSLHTEENRWSQFLNSIGPRTHSDRRFSKNL